MSRSTLKTKLEQIRAKGKRLHSTGMIYNTPSQLTRKYQKIILYALFVSDEETFLLRPHTFESKKAARDAYEWAAWLAEHYRKIVDDGILPGLFNRTGIHWELKNVIGWTPDASTRPSNTKTRKKRNKAGKRRK